MRKLALPLLVLVLASLASAQTTARKYSAQPRLRAYRQLHDVLEQRRSPSNAELTDVSESLCLCCGQLGHATGILPQQLLGLPEHGTARWNGRAARRLRPDYSG